MKKTDYFITLHCSLKEQKSRPEQRDNLGSVLSDAISQNTDFEVMGVVAITEASYNKQSREEMFKAFDAALKEHAKKVKDAARWGKKQRKSSKSQIY